MLNFIDRYLNNTTMYRLILYYLIGLLVIAGFYSLIGVLPFSFAALAFSTGLLLLVSWAANTLFAHVYKAPTNVESVYITALILVLIISPPKSVNDVIFLGWAAVLSMASKYILAVNRKHLFNPAALAVVITAIIINQSASWWVGTTSLLPFVLAGGVLVVRKIRRLSMVLSFFITAVLTITSLSIFNGSDIFAAIRDTLFSSPLFFLGFVMLTEPLTTPPTKTLQIIYGAIVGFLFSPQVHLGSLYTTPELSLIIGNIYSYFASPKEKLLLHIKEKFLIANGMYDFIFHPSHKLAFQPGQYMEWTLSHPKTDDRGNRRYFTIASSPTETDLRIGVKFNNPSSSYKEMMLAMDNQTPIVASQLAGDFTMPPNPHRKLVFIAGGIGVTPFRSMVKYLIDTNQTRDIILLYTNRTESEIAYRDIFNEAEVKLGLKVVYFLTDKTQALNSWQGRIGRISAEVIKEEVSDYTERFFYLSGPQSMVTDMEKILKNMNIPKQQVKTDYFPGF